MKPYKSEAEELKEQLDLLKMIIILPLAIALIFSLTIFFVIVICSL